MAREEEVSLHKRRLSTAEEGREEVTVEEEVQLERRISTRRSTPSMTEVPLAERCKRRGGQEVQGDQGELVEQGSPVIKKTRKSVKVGIKSKYFKKEENENCDEENELKTAKEEIQERSEDGDKEDKKDSISDETSTEELIVESGENTSEEENEVTKSIEKENMGENDVTKGEIDDLFEASDSKQKEEEKENDDEGSEEVKEARVRRRREELLRLLVYKVEERQVASGAGGAGAGGEAGVGAGVARLALLPLHLRPPSLSSLPSTPPLRMPGQARRAAQVFIT